MSSPEKIVEFSAWSGDLVEVKDEVLGSSEYSVTVVGLVSFLLHCMAPDRPAHMCKRLDTSRWQKKKRPAKEDLAVNRFC